MVENILVWHWLMPGECVRCGAAQPGGPADYFFLPTGIHEKRMAPKMVIGIAPFTARSRVKTARSKKVRPKSVWRCVSPVLVVR